MFFWLVVCTAHPYSVVRIRGEASTPNVSLGPLRIVISLAAFAQEPRDFATGEGPHNHDEDARLTREKMGIGSAIVPILVISMGLRSKTSTPMRSPSSSNRSIPVACSSLVQTSTSANGPPDSTAGACDRREMPSSVLCGNFAGFTTWSVELRWSGRTMGVCGTKGGGGESSGEDCFWKGMRTQRGQTAGDRSSERAEN